MGKLLILSVTNGEEQILDRIKDFLAEEPGIEIVEQPTAKHTPVSYTHLDVYKRQLSWSAYSRCPAWAI